MKNVLRFSLALLTAALSLGASAPAATSPDLALAVLVRPADPGSKYLAAEYARDLIHVLGAAETLRLVPRSRMLRAESAPTAPREIGQAVGANYVLSCSVRLTADALDIGAELIESTSGRQRWHQSYTAKLAQTSSFSPRIAHDAFQALALDFPKGTAHERDVTTNDATAWEHYLRGRLALDTLAEPSLVEAIAHFERAVSADATFTAAQVGLATAHIALGYNFQSPRPHFEKARQCLARATASPAPLVEAAIDDAVLKYYHDWDWPAAAAGAAFATRQDPSAVETHACFLHCAQTLGRLEDGRQEIAAAHHAQPESPAIRCELPCADYYAGRLADAERDSRDALKADPDNPVLYWSLARTLAQQGRFDAALAELKTAQGKPGGDWLGILSEVAYIHGRQNHGDAARDVIAQLRGREKSEYVDHYLYAMAFAGLGDATQVFQHLQQAASDRSTWIPSLPTDPKFAAFKSDARYQELMTTLKLASR